MISIRNALVWSCNWYFQTLNLSINSQLVLRIIGHFIVVYVDNIPDSAFLSSNTTFVALFFCLSILAQHQTCFLTASKVLMLICACDISFGQATKPKKFRSRCSVCSNILCKFLQCLSQLQQQ